MVEHGHIIVTQTISLLLIACKPCHRQIMIYFGGTNLTFHFWLCLEKYLVTMDPNFGILTPSNFVPWLLTYFAWVNIDINHSNLEVEYISHATG